MAKLWGLARRRAAPRSRWRRLAPATASVGGALLVASLIALASSPAAIAAQPWVGLGTASPFAVLAGTTVTNTGPSTISGDLGVSPGTAVTGFPPGTLNNGVQHDADAVALQAQSDLVTAYNDAAGRTPFTNETGVNLGGQTLAPGVYRDASGMSLTGMVTLDAAGDPNAVFIFQAGSTLITGSSSTVALIGGAQACNVFWQVGSSATLGTNTTFVGTLMSLTTATLQTGATVSGRVLSRNGAVNLDTNTITRPTCATTPTPTRTPTPAATATGTKPTAGPTHRPRTASASGGGSTTSGSGSSTSSGAATGSSSSSSSGGGSGTVVPLGHPDTGRPGTSRVAPPRRTGPESVFGFGLGLGGLCLVGASVGRMRRPGLRRHA